jgi:hypothetical protein
MMQNLMENPNPRSEFLKNESFAGVSSILARIEHKKDFDGFHQVKRPLTKLCSWVQGGLREGGWS